jgi:ParB/RepB/Spo0J family partition protein
MAKEKIEEIEVQLMKLSEIKASELNANVMPDVQFAALVADMQSNGIGSIDPIVVMKKPDGFVVIDGNHRLRAAKSLGWKEIRVTIATGIKDDTEALLYAYRKNAERGSMDPYKQADLFKALLAVNGMTEAKLALDLSVDRTLISHRLALLRIDEQVRKEIPKVLPNATGSHLEIIGTADPAVQKKVLANIKEEYDEDSLKVLSTGDLRDDIAQAKKEYDDEQRLNKALTGDPTSKFKKCPDCGKPPEEITYEGLPYVECESGHEWSLKSGKSKLQEQKERAIEKGPGQQKVTPREIPDYVRTSHTIEEFASAASNYAQNLIAKFDHISSLSIDGTLKGEDVSITIDDMRSAGLTIRSDLGGKDEVGFFIESKKYDVESLKQYHAVIRRSGYGSIESEKELKKLDSDAAAFLEKYAPKGPAAAPKKKRGRPRKNG